MDMRRKLYDFKAMVAKIYEDMMGVSLDVEVYNRLERLECRILEILKVHETTWKIKTRIQWLKEGDLNTILFHKSANG